MGQVRSALSRKAIIDTAVERLDEGAPFSSLTIRALAEKLEVTPMALYRHVTDKDDLLLEVIDRLMARGGLPPADADWQTAMAHLVDSLRALFVAHPAMVEVVTRRPITTPASLARFRAGLAALERGGFSRTDAVEVFAAVQIFVIGFSAIEGGRAGYVADHPLPPMPEDEARIIATFPAEGPFRRGLKALMDGLEAELLETR